MCDLSQVPSISGFEDEFADLIIKSINDKVERVTRDTLGNVIAMKSGSGKNRVRLLFEAHLDQIGVMITKVENNGILRFTGIGGINPLTLLGKRVRVFAKRDLYGIIGMKPPHLISKQEMGNVPPIGSLFIDGGFSSSSEAEKLVTIGDVAIVDYYSDPLMNEHFSSSGLDNKAGVITLLSLIDILNTLRNYHDIYFLFAVQEEVGLRGARVGGHTLDPDIAVVCDVTFADPFGDALKVKTGKGPVIGMGPSYFQSLVNKICNIAKREDIPIQKEIEARPGGTDAYYLQITRRGVQTAGISIPLRYMHSPVEIINLKDIYRAAKLMAQLAIEESLTIDH
jgi:endoglucanase